MNRRVFTSRHFWVGFGLSTAIFLVVNATQIVQQTKRICFDCDKGFGFPFRIYESGTVFHDRAVLWTGVLGDLIVIAAVGTLLGLLLTRLTSERLN